MRYQVWCEKGWMENQRCVCASEDGAYPTLKRAVHGVLVSMGPLIAGVFASKLRSMTTGEPWAIRNPTTLHLVDVSFVDQVGGAIPLAQLYIDEDRLEIVEALITDPDTNRRCDPPIFTVYADANG